MPPKKKNQATAKKEEMGSEDYGLSVAAAASLEHKVALPAYGESLADMKRAVGKSLEDYPRGENSDFRALVPERDQDDGFWMDFQEDEIQALVEEPGSLPKELCECPPVVDATWRTCFRFLGCLASDIVGRKNHLGYGSNSHRAKNACWSESFCKVLQCVMLHPHFRKSTAKMGLALQWASICRTEDGRNHTLNGCSGDAFLMMLQDVINCAPGQPAAVQLEVAHLIYKQECPGEDPPAWYQLLVNIDDASKRVQNKFGRLPDDMSELYMVTSEDVAAVLTGLDGIRYFSLRLYQHHDMYHDAITFTRCSDDRPSKPYIEQAIKKVVLADLRHQKKQELLGRSTPDLPRRPL